MTTKGNALKWLTVGCLVLLSASYVGAQPEPRAYLGTVKLVNESGAPITFSAGYLRSRPDGKIVVDFQQINISTKAIRSATIEYMDGAGGRQTSTGFFCSLSTCGLLPGAQINGNGVPDEGGFDIGRNVQLRVDFVLFADGTSWGPDRSGDSMVNFGYESGFKTAIGFVRRLLEERQMEKLDKLLSTQLSDTEIASVTGCKDDKWIKGYRFGYNLTISNLAYVKKTSQPKGLEMKLVDFERTVVE